MLLFCWKHTGGPACETMLGTSILCVHGSMHTRDCEGITGDWFDLQVFVLWTDHMLQKLYVEYLAVSAKMNLNVEHLISFYQWITFELWWCFDHISYGQSFLLIKAFSSSQTPWPAPWTDRLGQIRIGKQLWRWTWLLLVHSDHMCFFLGLGCWGAMVTSKSLA